MSHSVFFIAEAGVNHNGSLDLARRLVDVAAEAGADAVKFQTFKAENLVTASARKAQYQIDNTQEDGGQLAMLRRLELPHEDHEALLEHCRTRGIAFMSTGFDAESLALLGQLNMPAIKIPSGDITCGPLLLQAAQLHQKLIVSTGMSTLGDIEQALAVIAFGLMHSGTPASRAELQAAYSSPEGRQALRDHVTLLHCVTQYPAPPSSVHLRAMDTMRDAFGLPVGYSDHTLGLEVSIAAVARGATVIEKHFTLDRSMPGPDHAASLEPEELKELVRSIRVVEQALGTAIKGPAREELDNRRVARRSVVAARPIERGEKLTLDKLAYKRPGEGISPMDIWFLADRPARDDYQVDELIAP
ncbi:N-acetylneuraminate synthase [Pelomonas sp. P7]|uniref:N-acetylneuraminate synthase n=1 Tax=Pelomonas caseinilytica TaxID=2906763 RepID=A0ABS8XEI8_9BURK|nr:N-acetylneuraminate synthase [Pelomonas sp. P7]